MLFAFGIGVCDHRTSDGNIIVYNRKLCPNNIYTPPEKITEDVSIRFTYAKKTPDVYLTYGQKSSIEFIKIDDHHYARKRRCKLVTDFFKGKVYEIGDQIVLKPQYIKKYTLFNYNPLTERLMKILYCNKTRNEMAKLIPEGESQAILDDDQSNQYYLRKFTSLNKLTKFMANILLQKRIEKKSKIAFTSAFDRDEYCATEATTNTINLDGRQLVMYKLVLNIPLKAKFKSFIRDYITSIGRDVDKFMDIQRKLISFTITVLINGAILRKDPVEDTFLTMDGEIRALDIKSFKSEMSLLKIPFFAQDMKLFLRSFKPAGTKLPAGITNAYNFCLYQYYSIYGPNMFNEKEVQTFFEDSREYFKKILESDQTFIEEYSKFGEYLFELKKVLKTKGDEQRKNKKNKKLEIIASDKAENNISDKVSWFNFLSSYSHLATNMAVIAIIGIISAN